MGNYLKYFNPLKTFENSLNIVQRDGAQYGFMLIDDYAINENSGSSYSVCRIEMNVIARHELVIEYNANLYGSGNGTNSTQDKGYFSILDHEFPVTGSTPAEDIKVTCTHSKSNYYEITYDVPTGHHFIDVKVYVGAYSTSGVTNKLIFKIKSFNQIEDYDYSTNYIDFESVVRNYDVPLAEIIYTDSGTYIFDSEDLNELEDNFEEEEMINFTSRRYIYKSTANDSIKRMTYSRRVDIGDFVYDSSNNAEKITRIRKTTNKVMYLNDKVYYNKKLLKRHVLSSASENVYKINNFKQYKYVLLETYPTSNTPT